MIEKENDSNDNPPSDKIPENPIDKIFNDRIVKSEASTLSKEEDIIVPDFNFVDEFSNSSIQIKKRRLKVLVYFYFLDYSIDYTYNVEVNLNIKSRVKDIIPKAVSVFNLKNFQIDLNGQLYQLVYSEKWEDVKHYELRLTNKNLKPKMDMPPFYKGAFVDGIENEKFSFVSKKKSALIMKKVTSFSYLDEIDKIKSSSQKSCNIF